MPGWVSHNDQRVMSLMPSVLQDRGSKLERPGDLASLIFDVTYGKVEVDLLWNRTARPVRPRQRLDLLNRERWRAVVTIDHDEMRVVAGILPGPVAKTEEGPQELGQRRRVIRVKHRADQDRERGVHHPTVARRSVPFQRRPLRD